MGFKATSPDKINRAVTKRETRTCQRPNPETFRHLEVKEFEKN